MKGALYLFYARMIAESLIFVALFWLFIECIG